MLPKVTPLRCSNVHTKFGEIIFSLILSNLELNSFYLWNRHQLDQTHLFDSVQLFMLILYSTRNPKPVGFVNFEYAEKYRNILPAEFSEFSKISKILKILGAVWTSFPDRVSVVRYLPVRTGMNFTFANTLKIFTQSEHR